MGELPGESVRAATGGDAACFALRDYLDGVVEKLRENVPKALTEHDAEAVHDARVATRRLKAALDLLGPVLGSVKGGRRFAKVLRKLRRRLGDERDLEVMLGHVNEHAGEHAAAAAWLAERLGRRQCAVRAKADRGKAAEWFLARVNTWPALRAEVDSCPEAIDVLLGQSLHLQLDAFAERAGRLSGTTPGDELHQLRIAGKRLRYTLEMAEEEGHEQVGGVMKVFKKMQDALGDWHDYVVLAQWTLREMTDECVVEQDMALAGDVLKMVEEVLRKGRAALDEFSRLWAEHGAEVAGSIRQAFPLTRAVTGDAPGAGGADDRVEMEPPAPVGEAGA